MRTLLASLAVLTTVPALGAEVTGYVESRTQYQRSRVTGLLPTDSQPEVQQLLELNVQPRQAYRPGGFIAADLSLFLQASGRYRGLGAEGQEVSVAEKEKPSRVLSSKASPYRFEWKSIRLTSASATSA